MARKNKNVEETLSKKEVKTQAETKDKKVSTKQKKLTDMQVTDGKLYNKYGVKSIDELLGIKSNKYNTTDILVYENQINSMNTSDLQNHATLVGVMPNQDRGVLIKRLLKTFKVQNSEYIGGAVQNSTPLPKKLSQEALDILAQGR